MYVKSTKTGIVRTVKMDSRTMAILNEWQKKQKADYFKLGFNTKSATQLVFSNEENKFLQPTKTRKWIIQIQTRYNLKKVSTHGMRHTHCSLLFEAGAKIKEVQDRLGHSDIQTTMNIYAHVTAKAKESAIQKFEAYLSI
ncbi:tyrosine-type recombinase/integrase [Viridibacillus arvi]|uniref:tyrosine-type recombinase/integrase n=1 Tax=Viridibacillus arvi TaxID=263475 RepID=UPI000A700358|nr:site-specific integrase [Viridibacillus arvi]